MSKLKQNNLEESTTDIGFLRVLNENKADIISLERQVTLEDGTVVTVENVTPSKMKNAFNSLSETNKVIYETPGEKYEDKNGIVQIYNINAEGSPEPGPGPEPQPSRLDVTYTDAEFS